MSIPCRLGLDRYQLPYLKEDYDERLMKFDLSAENLMP